MTRVDRSTIALGAHATAWGALLLTSYLVRTGGLGTGVTEGLGAIVGFAVFALLAAWSCAQIVDRLERCSRAAGGAGAVGVHDATSSRPEASRALGSFGATTIVPTRLDGVGTAVSSDVVCSHRHRRGLTMRRPSGASSAAARPRCGREVG